MSGIELLVDPQSFKVGLPASCEVIGSGAVAARRVVSALAFSEYGTGSSVIFGGEYISDIGNSFVADADGFAVGMPPVLVSRMV